MATLDQLRSLFPDAQSDSDVIKRAATEFGIDPKEIASEIGVKINAPGLWTSVKRGIGQVESALGSTARDLGADRAGRALESYGEDVAFRNPSAINTVGEALSSPWQTAKEAIGEIVPQVGLSGAVGLGGRAIGGALGAPLGPAGVVAGQAIGGSTAAYLANLAQEYGGIRAEQRESGKEDKTRALAAGGAAAVLDTAFGAERLVNKVGNKGLDILSRGAGEKLAPHVLKQTGLGILGEAGTETAQTALERTGAFKELTGADALNEYGLAAIKGGIGGGAIRGGMSLFAGQRQADAGGNDVSQAITSKDTTQPDITTTDFQPRELSSNLMAGMIGRGADPLAGRSTVYGGEAPATREVITEDGEIIQVPIGQPAPAVTGGSTDVAIAQQQAKQQADQQQAQAQQAQAADQAAQQFGVVNPATPAVGSAFGQKVYGKNIPAVANAIATFTSKMPPQQVALAQAITQANAETGGQLIKFQFNANDVVASVNKGFQAIGKVATQLQIDQAESMEEAAAILNDQSAQLKGDKLDQLNAIFQAITGRNTNGYEAAQLAQLAKGAKNERLQLQTNAGLREVPVSGGATETGAGGTGGVRPTQVQPVGATSVGAGPSNLQIGFSPAGGVRPSAGDVPNVGSGEATSQVSEATGGQAQTNVQGAQAVTGERLDNAAPEALSEGGQATEGGQAVQPDSEQRVEGIPDLITSALRMIFKSDKKVALLRVLMQQRSDYQALADEYKVSLAYVKELAAMAKIDLQTGLPKFLVSTPDALEKFRAACQIQAEKLGVTVDEVIQDLDVIETAYESSPYGTEADEADMAAAGLEIQNREFRTDNQGKSTGKSDLTNVTNLVDEGDMRDMALNAYEKASIAYEDNPSDANLEIKTAAEEFASRPSKKTKDAYQRAVRAADALSRAESMQKLLDTSDNLSDSDRANLEQQIAAQWQRYAKIQAGEETPAQAAAPVVETPKEAKNAVQKRSTKKVPVQERAKGSEAVGEGNAEGGQVATEGEAKVEAKPKQEVVVLTPVEKYEAIAADYPLVPPYESLTEAERARWDDLASRTEVDVTDIARLVGTTKATQTQQVENDRTIDGTGLVREITPEQVALLEAPVSKLTEGQTVRLERHYGAKRGTSEFLTKLHDDISLYAAKGVEAVNAAIRDIIKAIYTAVLAVAVVFNPTYMNKAEAYTFSPAEEYSVTKEVRAEAPAEAASKMSPAAKEAYATLMPALKAELTAKDKLLVMADKPSGRIFVFTPDGKLVIEKKSLFGLAKGDFYKGNNDLPSNRITPAGLHDIVMVDAAKGGAAAKTAGEYDFGKVFGIVDKNPGVLTIMHSVWLKETDAPKRAAALKSENAADSRFSFGCINVDKVTYKNLIDNYGQQMDGAKLFVVPDNQERLNDFVTGKVAQNLTNEDALVRQAVTPVTETTTGVRQNVTQAAETNRTVVGKEEQAPANEPAQQAKTTQQSRRRRGKGEKYTPEMLKASLLDFMNRAKLGKEVVIVDDLEELRDHPDFADMDDVDSFFDEQGIDYDTQAFVYKGKAYMLAGNIALGTGRGVFMHEVGVHLGIQQGLSREQIARLASRVELWAKNKDGSIESTLAAHAISRMKASKTEGTQARQNETIAYFLEAAVNAGIDPTAASKIGSAGLREWMRTLWAAFKNALRMVRGVNIDKVTAQDLVDLAYGYAQMSATRFHGSNANFRKFLTKFMNSGAGGQQYGWGTYFAEARPTAEGYSVPEMDAPAGTRSHVYTIDLAITPEEMILWNKPMSEQSALVQAAAAKHPVSSMYTGMDFYKGTAERLYEEKYGVEPTKKAERTEAEMMASQFMDSLGIKGIQYLDATTATRDTSNFVVFNEDNIIRVQTETGLASDRQAMRPDFTWERVQQSRAAQPAGMFTTAGAWLDQAMTSPREALQKLKLGFLTLDQLAELDTSSGQIVRAYSNVMTAMQKTSKDMIYKASQIDQLWAKLTKKDSDNLSSVMRDATRAQFDPSLGVAGKNQTQQDIMDAYRALPSSAKDVYAKVKKYYEDAFKTRLAIMETSAAKLGGKELDEIRELYSKLKGPYFPLGRTGSYYAVGMSPRVAELMAKKEDQGLSSSETTELSVLRKQADQYKTSSFNTLYEAKKAAEQFKKEFGESYYNETEVNIESAMSKMPNFAKLEESITTQLGGETRAEVKNMLAKLMFDSLPEHHALKNQMRREGIYGENEDMRQVFAQTSISQAHYISRLQFGGELNSAMLNIGKAARRDIGMRQIQNELKLRTKLSMDNTQSALTDAMVNASYFAHLGLSPAFLLTNMTQVPMITAPWLGARHGVGATKRAMAMALSDTAKIIKTSFKDGDWRSEINWNTLFPAGTNEDRLFRDLLDRNVLDITMEHDLAAIASAQKGLFDDKISQATGGKLGGMGDVIKMVNTPVRITELANRAVTALSAYRLKMEALKSAPMTAEERHAASVDYAARAVSETQLNYSELNAPRHMRQVFGSKPLAKMIFQFRKYQQGMLYLIAKNISDALPGSKVSKEDRRIARRTIAGLYMTTGLMAGTTGMPLMGTVGVAGIANLIAAAFGDEDEPWDFEVEYRNFLTDWLGKDMALLVAKGLPAYLGVDLSKRVGMGDIANPIPFVQRGQTGQSTVANVLYAAGGAPVGMVGTMYDGIVAMANGDVMKGMEKVVPVKAVKDALRAYRYSDEGMTDKRGNVILAPEKFDTWDLALRGMGFSPTKETEYYAANAAMQAAKTAATDVRTRLLRDYSEAKLKGESTEAVDAKIIEFNERHPEKGVRIDFSTKIKAVQARRKMANERTESGVRIGKNEKPFASEARFATQE